MPYECWDGLRWFDEEHPIDAKPGAYGWKRLDHLDVSFDEFGSAITGCEKYSFAESDHIDKLNRGAEKFNHSRVCPLNHAALMAVGGDQYVATRKQEPRMIVKAREGEPFEELYRRFKRGMEASGILREYRRKQRFRPAHEERRDKIRNAARKKRRALMKSGGRDR